MLRHPLTHVRAGRYRTRTARPRRRRGSKHPSGVFVSARFPTRRNVYQERCRQTIRSGDFLWWAVQGSNRAALTTPVGRVSNQPSGLLLSPRFSTARNVYRDDFRFVADGTGLEQHGHAAGGATNTPVGCLLVRGSQRVGMSTKKDAARPLVWGLFSWWTVQNSNSSGGDRRLRRKQGAEAGAAF